MLDRKTVGHYVIEKIFVILNFFTVSSQKLS